jgi:hypothetical protein
MPETRNKRSVSLPQIAKTPFTARVPAPGLALSQRPSALHSPYLPPGDKLNNSLYHLPGATPSQRSGPQSPQHAATARTTNEADAAPSSSDPPTFRVNELTLTYLKVLQRSEDYNRRSIMQDRSRGLKAAEKPWKKYNEFVAEIIAKFRDVYAQEKALRLRQADDEEKQRQHMHRLADQSHATAKRHEDIRPSCPLIANGQQVHLDPQHAYGLTVELRWRGGCDVDLHFFTYDEADRPITVGSKTDIIRGTEGSIGIRQIAASDAFTLGTGGSRSCFQLNLANLQARTARIVVVALAAGRQQQLKSLSRSWLTLYDTGKNPSKLGQELYASGCLEGGTFSGIVTCSFTRRTGNVWIYKCINESLMSGIPPGKLGPMLPLLFRSNAEFQALHFAVSRERLIGYAMSACEEGPRAALAHHESKIRGELAVAAEFEYARAHKRSLQNMSYRAFTKKPTQTPPAEVVPAPAAPAAAE